MTPICSLKNLTLTFPLKTIFKEVNFTLNQGDRIGVLGLNGHGKSSFFKVLTEELKPDTTVPPFIFDKSKEFSIFLVPQELPVIKGVSLANYFYEFHPQFKDVKVELDDVEAKMADPDANLDKLIERQSTLYEKLHSLGEDISYNQYISYLKAYGITDHEQDISNLSGGEQRKIALSLGLSAPQKVILWDEPTNHLDVEAIEDFEDELRGQDKTFMIISHDRTFLNNTVDRIVHIKNGKLNSFSGTYNEYLTFLQDEEQRREKEIAKLSNVHRRETAWIRRGVSARRTKSKKRIEDYSTLSKEITDLKARAHKKVSMNIASSGRKTKILAKAENLGMTFGDKTLFKGVNFEVHKGEKIALLGRNGVGKSTLLKLLLGEISQTEGEITRAHLLTTGFFSQKREALQDEMTPWELIGEGTDYVVSNTGMNKHVAGYLESFLFKSEELKRPISTFSGGEKNRLQLAKFMRNAQDIWIFDEPTNDLDLETIGVLEDELKNYKGALIVIGHDRAFIENVTDKAWLIHDQQLEIFEGGFSQAKLYMDAMVLEDRLKEMEAKQQVKTKVGESKIEKLSYKEKLRFDEIQGVIEKQEALVAELEEKLDQFDYSAMDASAKEELVVLQKKLDKEKQTLDDLFEEWTILEEKAE
ncbi:MAG: ABC transporter ATP-binding protein [Deltaproteobacteria bacterium]|nr:MAG: ABC transporter ATP-binding protein [Deltaproteobacteria bacterium]TNF25373.1 MAG: ABC transporter ATP-binding protein [Deltaproteobacteria bacterium]